MRPLALVLLAILCGCSDFFSPPCMKAAKAVCDVGSEGDACAFLLDRGRDDARAQDVCKEVLSQARALQKTPNDASARLAWQSARTTLGTLGFAADPKKGRIEEKLKAAGGSAGKLVESLEKNSALGEQQTAEGAMKALEGETR